MTREVSAKQKVNYLWVGPPAELIEGGMPGHDCIGPLAMMGQIDHFKTHLFFWCLKKFERHYQAKFANKPITICAMEDFLNEHRLRKGISGEQILTIFETLLGESRAQIKDCVTLKELFALFLMTVQGGYVLDTNILPAYRRVLVNFPHYSTFMVPALNKSAEVWMMYSPPDNPNHADEALNFFIRKLDEIEKKIFPIFQYTKPFFTAIRNVIACSICLSDDHRLPAVLSKIKLWETKITGHMLKVTIINGPEIVKYYFNTHVLENFSSPEKFPTQLHFTTREGDIKCLAFLLANNADVNLPISFYRYENFTPLHAAILYKQPAAACLLLAHGANLQLCVIAERKKSPVFFKRDDIDDYVALLRKYFCDEKQVEFIQQFISPQLHAFRALRLFAEEKKRTRVLSAESVSNPALPAA